MTEIVIDGKYELGHKIGKGLFSEIHEGRMIHANNAVVAVKLEDIESKYPQIEFEAKILERLSGTVGVPLMYNNCESLDYNVVVMQKLGSNLKQLLDDCMGRLGLKTTLILADKMFCILEQVHNKGVVHRDIKPENWCIGEGSDSHNLYLIDYGLSKVYLNENGKHIPHKKNKTMLG
jgi:serine/threonine protein kinase